MNHFENASYDSIAALIAARQNELGTPDHQIAVALGYTCGKVVELIKQGSMRLPLNKVVELAGVLDVDAVSLLRLALRETDPALLLTIERVLGPVAMSPSEMKLVQEVRKFAKGRTFVTVMFDRDSMVALVEA